MPKKKMRFPEVPGDTPRQQFENLVRGVLSIPKADIQKGPSVKRRAKSHKGPNERRQLR
jgi:hypothetical protein